MNRNDNSKKARRGEEALGAQNAAAEEKEALPVGEEEVREAARILSEYKRAKANLDTRVTDNEQWFRLRHWEQLRKPEDRKIHHSGWLFNSIVSKHADFMDSMPQCTVLPREKEDEKEAARLTSVIPVILERGNWQSVYSDAVYAKLKTGTAVYSVLWDPDAEDGLGDIAVSRADILNLFWEPGVRDIQSSRHLFYVQLEDNDILTERWPELEGKLGTPGTEASAYLYDAGVDTSKKSTVVDWYYKKRVDGRTVVHYCKFVNGVILYASENDPALKERGWYDHGLYPFVFDPLFREEGTPAGFGMIDVMKEAQEDIDLLGNELIRNARLSARKRYFTRIEGAVNEEEFADLSRDFVHVSGSTLGEDSLREITSSPLSPVYLTVLNNKIQELKETSGNRDFSQGGTMGGVTSGTAINALQEAGNKLARDMIAMTYHAFSQVCTLVIELIRQFYSAPRCMRILGPDGDWEFPVYDNAGLLPMAQDGVFGMEAALRKPVFDVSVKAHKQNTYSRSAQNQDALSFYQLGFFDPAKAKESLACLELIDIENKEKLVSVITRNGEAYAARQ